MDEADLHGVTGKGVVRRLSLEDGSVIDEFDPEPGPEEVLEDVHETSGDPTLLVRDTSGLNLAEGLAAELILNLNETELVAARFITGGVVTAEAHPDEGCSAWWRVSGDPDVRSLPEAVCTQPEALVVDPLTGSVFVTADGQVATTSPSGADLTWASDADLLAWEPTQDLIVGAARGSDTVTAWTATGEEVWTTSLNNKINAIDDLGKGGGIALSTTPGTGGRIVILDAKDGALLGTAELPVAGRAISGGGQGQAVALVLKSEVHVFDLVIDALDTRQ